MYGGKSSPNQYCSINTFLKYKAPTLLENIEDLCMVNLLTPKKRGITFLLPDEKTLAKIDNMVGNDMKAASANISAIIIPIYLGSIDEFKRHKDNLYNSLKKDIEIKNVTSKLVEFKNGTQMNFENIYKSSRDDESRIAVYSINGLMSTTGKFMNENNISGGNDSDIKTLRNDSGCSIELMIKSAKANSTIQASLSQKDYLLMLGISLLNYMVNGSNEDYISAESKTKLNKIGKICIRVHPHSPLYYLHLMPLLNNDEREKWCDCSLKYSKYNTLMNFMKDGYSRNLENKWDTSVLKTVRTFKIDTICELSKEIFKNRCSELLSDISPSDYKTWGDFEGFVCWLCGVSEFTFLYANHYMNAIDNKETEEINVIIDTFARWYILNNKSYSDKLVLLDENISNDILIFTKERFCTILSLVLSRAFSPMGSDFPQKGSELIVNDNITTTNDHAPNKIIISAFIPHRFAQHASKYLND